MNNKDLKKTIKSVMHSLVFEKGYACALDVLMKLEYLSKKDYNDWRFGKIEFLEKVCNINLEKLSTINLTIRKIANEMNLKSFWTGYTTDLKVNFWRLEYLWVKTAKIDILTYLKS